MQKFNMGRVPPVTFGAGQLSKLPKLVSGLADGPVLVIADTVLATLGVTEQVSRQMSENGLHVDVAAEIAGEPKETLVDTLCQRARVRR